MRYQIKGLDGSQGVVSLECEAASVQEARAHALDRGVNAIAIRETGFSWHTRRDSVFDLLLFSQELHALLVAGLSIVEALATISRKEPPSYKRTLVEDLSRELREGKPFSQSLRSYPKEFPPLYLALAAASERTGDLPHALFRFIAYRTRMDELRKRMTSALLYPSLLTGTGGLVILFLMFYVVPRFSRIYEDFGHNLPLMSRLLMKWGALVSQHGASLAAGGAGLLLIGFVLLRGRISFRTVLHLLTQRTPLGERLRRYELSQFYRTTGLLQEGGIPLVTAMEMAGDLLGDSMRPMLALALTGIRSGLPFSSALEGHGLAPPVALDLIKIGEKSGALGEKLIRIADFYDDEQSRWIEGFSRLFEPALMLGIGLLIAFIIVLLYMPIFNLAENLQ